MEEASSDSSPAVKCVCIAYVCECGREGNGGGRRQREEERGEEGGKGGGEGR